MSAELPILAQTIPDTSRTLGVGPTKTKKLISDGVLETITIGYRRLVLYASTQAYVESLRGQPGDPRRNKAVPKAGERRPHKPEAAA